MDRAEILQDFVLALLRDVTALDEHRLTATSTLLDLGLESLAVMDFNARLAADFPDASKTFLYDCRTIRDVAFYLERNHPDATRRFVTHRAATPPSALEDPDEWRPIAPIVEEHSLALETDRAIAIIGMNGRFPGAASLEQFWLNLIEGRDSIDVIPAERWSLEGFYQPPEAARDASRSYIKTGGFIADVDRFDAQFFGVASREAALMDPQARIFLECAWHALEDAAILGERGIALEHENALDIGVFLGQTTNTYSLLGPDRWRTGSSDIPTCMPWSAANRLSFVLNLIGPSVAVDTACSSSLVAIHMACESLLKGECKAAIVGGVNLYLHPSKYVQLCQQQMLSSTGRCRPFADDADGFVPGEGVGVLVLKPLATALSDGDRVRAVIRGSAVRHGGKTNGFTVPSPAAQARVVTEALEAAGISGDAISYVEAHGTGTKLGDPIEIDGLKRALGPASACVIGSVKANIGHLEAAAGVAGVIKAALQLEHRRIAPSLHAQALNSALALEDTQLSIARISEEWSAPIRYGVRRAGVSSFGAGGANAHAIIEEAPIPPPVSASSDPLPLVFLLSARSQPQLERMAGDLGRLAASPQTLSSSAFAAIAYTLQCGRRHLDYRVAIIARDRESLRSAVDAYLAGKTSADICTGRVFAAGSTPPADPAGSRLLTEDRVRHLARQWAEGIEIRWRPLWPIAMRPCVAPLYAFAPDRHWMPQVSDDDAKDAAALRSIAISIAQDDAVLRQHRIKGRPLYPAAAYIDLCARHAQRDIFKNPIELKNPTWQAPLAADDARPRLAFDYRIRQSGSEQIVEVVSSERRAETLHFRCHLAPAGSRSALPEASLEAVKARCGEERSLDATYSALAASGLDYGLQFRCMKRARIGQDEALIVLRQHEPRAAVEGGVFDIGMLDGVLQSAGLALANSGRASASVFVPFSAVAIRLYGPLDQESVVHVRFVSEGPGSKTFAFVVYGPDGLVRLEIDDLTFREVAEPHATRTAPSDPGAHSVDLLEPVWVAQALADDRRASAMLIFDTSVTLYDRLRDMTKAGQDLSAPWLVQESDRFAFLHERTVEWEPRSSKHQDLLWRLLSAQGGIPSSIVFNLTSTQPKGEDWKTSIGLARLSTVADVLRSLCRREGASRVHILMLMAPDDAEVQAAAGLLRSLHLEIPTLSATVTILDHSVGAQALAEIALVEAGSPAPGVTLVSYQTAERRVRQLRFIDHARPTPAALSPGQTFVLTGGMGSLGRVFASALASIPGSKLALLGRSEPTEDTRKTIAEIEAQGARATCWPVDCASRPHLAACLDHVRHCFGPITGVVHCAGVLRDAYFTRQTAEEWDDVLRTKALVAVHLDELTRHDPLRHFVLCSSLAGTYGNIGQSAYAVANGWLDGFAEGRNRKVERGERNGTTASIAWPLWHTEEGMQAPQTMIDWLARKGIGLLPVDAGRRVFLDVLAHPRALTVPLYGEREAAAGLFDMAPVNIEPKQAAEVDPRGAVNDETDAATLSYLVDALARTTGTPPGRIDPDSSLDVFGLDSILVAQMNAALETRFPDMPKTALFEARSLRALARSLVAQQAVVTDSILATTIDDAARAAQSLDSSTTQPALAEAARAAAPSTRLSGSLWHDGSMSDPDRRAGIAIIGMAGRYPGAETLAEFWQHLAAGDDLVTEVPGRWSDSSADPSNGIYARWGGFLSDVDAFDPLFFGISPRDAERMDPQERLFLQTAYHAIEDAGYTPAALSGAHDAAVARRRVAVIAGVMYGEYQHYGAQSGLQRPEVLANSSFASIANRVSFCFDLEGPSFAVDSMCSSSLTSIHLACQMLRAGSCEMALAGGVNLSLHPYKYRLLSDLKFASTDGKCRSFGEGGDGYVPGEGVGVFLLKPIERAIHEGDHIYAIIRGSDINHGGRTSGYTVPSADAQARVIQGAFRQAGVSPRRLSYVEAHGTGTSLGDPIEVRGLEKAIARNLPADTRCAIGSVKANIGHLESAAGAAALTKVLLQMKARRLAPSIHSERLNPNIDFANSPFVVQREFSEWTTPDGLPRLAAISAMGAGGSNAHMVVEDYEAPTATAQYAAAPALLLFSSRTRPQLDATLRRILADIREHLDEDRTFGQDRFTLTDVAGTLRYGRQAFEARLAVVTRDLAGACALIERYLAATTPPDDGITTEHGELFYATADTTSSHAALDLQMPLFEQAKAWCRGEVSAANETPTMFRKVPLAGYTFQQRRFWAGSALAQRQTAQSPDPTPRPLTPVIILEQVAAGRMSEGKARELLMAMR